MTTYSGYVESPEAIKARWQLMQKRAARKARKASKPAPACLRMQVVLDRLGMALAIKRQYWELGGDL